jgi:beta-lactamase regulating signal transducer with metallopeptidase domain
VDAVLHLGLGNAVLAAGLALAAALVRPLLRRRPALVHSLWLLVLLKLLTPPLVVVPLPWPEAAGDTAGSPTTAAPAEPVGPVALVAGLPPLEAPAVETAPPPAARETEATSPPGLSWQEVVLGVWLSGALLWWAVAAWRVLCFHRLLRLAEPAPADVQAQAGRLARRLGLRRCPGIWLVRAPVSPLLWALGRVPRLLVPAALWERLADDQRGTLLAHELAHLRRRDHWVRRLELVVFGLYWWHPAVWWAGRELREAEEQCCDAWVVWALPESAPAYAAALVETVAYLSAARPALPVAASGAGRVWSLKRRLTMILRDSPPRSLSVPGLLAVLGLAVVLLPLLPSWAQPAAAEQVEEPPAAAGRKQVAGPGQAGPGRGAAFADIDADGLVQAPKKAAGAAGRATPFQQQLRDEIELLEVQVEIKRAELAAARQKLTAAKLPLARLEKLYEAKTVSSEVVEEARAKVAAQEAQVRVKEAELREPEVRLRQVRRRLVAIQAGPGAAGPPSGATKRLTLYVAEYKHDFGVVRHGNVVSHRILMENRCEDPIDITDIRTTAGCVQASAGRTTLAPGQKTFLTIKVDTGRFTGPKQFRILMNCSERGGRHQHGFLVLADSRDAAAEAKGVSDPKRMLDLEKKLDALQKELDALRKQLPARQSSSGTGKRLSPDVMTVKQRTFKIPFNVSPPAQGGIKWIILYVSRDQGKNWRRAALGRPDIQGFDFTAPEDGLYWFSVTVVDGTEHAVEDPLRIEPSLKVLVDTTAAP